MNNNTKSRESWIWDAACSIRGAKDAPKFKDYSGQSAGEFYTPGEVGEIMALIMDPEPGMTCYDPTVADDHGDPEELLAKLDEAEKQTAALRDQLKAVLAEALLR